MAVVAEAERLQPRKEYPVLVALAAGRTLDTSLQTGCGAGAPDPPLALKETVQNGLVIVVEPLDVLCEPDW